MTGIEVSFKAQVGGFALTTAFVAPSRGVTALFGHSGSGKTTLLRCVAGLQQAEGRLVVNGEVWQEGRWSMPVHRRPLGYVFQEASLFPHLSVRRNLEYGWRRLPAAERRVAFDEAVALLGVERLLSRAPSGLSGGERQRVAIARALLTSPRLLLMDEPLSALDERSKAEILPYLERLHDELAIPIFYVSHSLAEVARLADHIVWLEKGLLKAEGPALDLLTRVDLTLRAGEAEAVLEGVVARHEEADHLTVVETAWGEIWLQRIAHAPGHRVRVRLPARDVSLALEAERQSSILNAWPAVIESITATEPGRVLVQLRPAADPQGIPLIARITERSVRQLGLMPGRAVFARIKSVGLMN